MSAAGIPAEAICPGLMALLVLGWVVGPSVRDFIEVGSEITQPFDSEVHAMAAQTGHPCIVAFAVLVLVVFIGFACLAGLAIYGVGIMEW